MHVVIFAGGTLGPGKAVNEAIATADLFIAADSGASTALRLGCTPSIVVGDFDSSHISTSELAALDIQVIRARPEKDETDTELAIQTAIERGATRITLLGAFGGERIDHTMANIMLLAGFEDIPMRLVDGPSICWLLRGSDSTSIQGQSGDLVSLIPLTGAATGVSTRGLYYPLYNETLNFGKPRGVSNVLISSTAEVSLESGLLLVIHTATQQIEIKTQEAFGGR